MTTRLSLYLCVFLFLAPSLLLASGFRLSENNLRKEVASVNEILRKEHQIRNITPPQKLPVSLLVRRVYLSAAGRIPSFTEIDALEPFDQQELKISLIDRLLLSKAYESGMFNGGPIIWAKTYVMGQANQVGVGFLYVNG